MSALQGLAPKREETRPTLPQQDDSSEAAASLRANTTTAPRRSKRKTPKSRLIKRATYEIGADLKKVIHEEAVRLGVPDSQLAKYLLLYAWDLYVDEKIPLPELAESSSPKYRHNIYFE
jgi:hypothetical protein